MSLFVAAQPKQTAGSQLTQLISGQSKNGYRLTDTAIYRKGKLLYSTPGKDDLSGGVNILDAVPSGRYVIAGDAEAPNWLALLDLTNGHRTQLGSHLPMVFGSWSASGVYAVIGTSYEGYDALCLVNLAERKDRVIPSNLARRGEAQSYEFKRFRWVDDSHFEIPEHLSCSLYDDGPCKDRPDRKRLRTYLVRVSIEPLSVVAERIWP